MSASQPALLETGHPEIDREHAVLLALLKKLDHVCRLQKPGIECRGCSARQRGLCETSLVVVMGSILGFTVDHFAFEEKAMRALPDEEAGAAHMQAHIHDHERITRNLRALALSVGSRDLVQSAIEIQSVVRGWLGEHILNFDVPFVGLSRCGASRT